MRQFVRILRLLTLQVSLVSTQQSLMTPYSSDTSLKASTAATPHSPTTLSAPATTGQHQSDNPSVHLTAVTLAYQ
jgi:hypothetical protein